MIFHKKKLQVTSYKLQVKQQGITLLLAILVLSSVLAISFSLSTILLIEVKSSGDLLRTEASLYGSNGIAEQAFFNQIRKVATSTCANGTDCYFGQFNNNVTLKTGYPVLSATSEPILHDKILPLTTFTTKPKIYSFCDLSKGVLGCGYGRVRVDYLPSGNQSNVLHAMLCQWNPNFSVVADGTGGSNSYDNLPCSDPGDNDNTHGTAHYWLIPNDDPLVDDILTPTSNNSVTWDLDPNMQQELILFNSSTSGTISVSIQTFGLGPTYAALGLPFIGQTAVTINTSNGDVGRKLQVVVPNSP